MSGSAKDIELRPIPSRKAREVIRRIHYSGKVAPNGQIHIGVFYLGDLVGAVQLGPPMDRRKVLHLVEGTQPENMMELNRLAIEDGTPKNTESRVIAITCRLMRQYRPQVKWLLSFADATQCGDGTIYRASGFALTAIKENTGILRLPDGRTVAWLAIVNTADRPRPELGGRSFADIADGTWSKSKYIEATGAVPLPGYQLRYIRFLDPTWRSRLTVPELPYSAITEAGASMYLGHASEA